MLFRSQAQTSIKELSDWADAKCKVDLGHLPLPGDPSTDSVPDPADSSDGGDKGGTPGNGESPSTEPQDTMFSLGTLG